MGTTYSSNRNRHFNNMAETELIGSYNYRGTIVKFCTGDITEIEGDVVLVSSDRNFTMNVGAARAIGNTGGHDFWQSMADSMREYDGTGLLLIDSSNVDNLPYEKVLVIPVRNQNRNSMRTLYREAIKGLIDSNEEIGVMPMIGCGGFRLDKQHASRELFEALMTFTTFRNLKELKFVDLSRRTMVNLYDSCAGLEGLAVPDLASQIADNATVTGVVPQLPTQTQSSASSEDIQVISERIVPRRADVIIDGERIPVPSRIIANEVMYVGETQPKQDDEQQMTKEALLRIYSEVDRTTINSDEGGSDYPCSICLNDLVTSCGDEYEDEPIENDPVVKLKLCPHMFHKSCIDNCLKVKKQCPLCMKWYALSFGTQPKNARMRVKRVPGNPPGHPTADGWFKITYTIPSGIQTINHIRPGEPYSGTTRSAFLPNDEEGRFLLRLLHKAFEYRHTFTIGDSVTTGSQNVPVWVIHHKTNMTGGSQHYGYPDADYYQRLKNELEQLGITSDILNE